MNKKRWISCAGSGRVLRGDWFLKNRSYHHVFGYMDRVICPLCGRGVSVSKGLRVRPHRERLPLGEIFADE